MRDKRTQKDVCGEAMLIPHDIYFCYSRIDRLREWSFFKKRTVGDCNEGLYREGSLIYLVACSVGVFWAGESRLFMIVLL